VFVNIKIKDSREFVWLYKVKMLKEQNEMLQEQLEAKLAATAVNDSSSSSAGLRSRPVRTCVCVCVCVVCEFVQIKHKRSRQDVMWRSKIE